MRMLESVTFLRQSFGKFHSNLESGTTQFCSFPPVTARFSIRRPAEIIKLYSRDG
jgi:hypothetical protein